MTALNPPDVKTYLDANQYLQDVYQFRKSQSKLFSYERWAQELGITSKSYLRFAILGERTISEQLTHKFCKSLQLDNIDTEYFVLLILYTQCSQPDQKKIYGRQLTQFLRKNVSMDELQAPDSIMLHPLYIVVRSLLSFTDIERSPESIAKILNMPESELTPILDTLQKEGLIQFTGKEWVATHDNVKIPDSAGKEAIRQYHKISLLKAIEAQKMPVEERSYRSLGLALSAEEYQDFLQDFDQFAKQTYAKFSSNEFLKRRFYQFNFNLFPWTQDRAPFVNEANS